MLDEFLQLAVAKVITLHFYLTEKLKVMQDIDHLELYIFKKQIEMFGDLILKRIMATETVTY